MNNIIRIKQTSVQKVYFCSDTHYNHNPNWNIPLWKSRGYMSVDEMNEDIIFKINDTVKENDILFHLGDITLNCSESQFNEFISKINCKNIYLLWGNHNNPCRKIYDKQLIPYIDTLLANTALPVYTEELEIYPIRYRNIIFIGDYQEIIIDGQYIIISHYPNYVFNYMKNGAWHLCGHSHCNLPLSQATNPESKILDVGWEGIKKPYSMSDIEPIMKSKNILKVDHHI